MDPRDDAALRPLSSFSGCPPRLELFSGFYVILRLRLRISNRMENVLDIRGFVNHEVKSNTIISQAPRH